MLSVPTGRRRRDSRRRRDVAAGESGRVDTGPQWRGVGSRERGVASVGLCARDGDVDGVVGDCHRARYVAERIIRVGGTPTPGLVRRRRSRARARCRGRAAGLCVQRRRGVAIHEARIDRHNNGSCGSGVCGDRGHRGTRRSDRQRGRSHREGARGIAERIVGVHRPVARRRVGVPRYGARARRRGRTGCLGGQR